MSNTIEGLRSILFDTLRQLNNPDSKLDLDRARAINDTAQTIINSAKVEVDFARTVGSPAQSSFLGASETSPPPKPQTAIAPPTKPARPELVGHPIRGPVGNLRGSM